MHTCVYEYVCAHMYSVHVCRYVHIVCMYMCIRVNVWLNPLSLGVPQVPFIKKLHWDSFLLALFSKLSWFCFFGALHEKRSSFGLYTPTS